MQITGNIANIQPTGGYQPKDPSFSYQYTFNMTINTAQGPVTGQISSISQQYPMQIGETIVVESKNSQHGVKFQKINPQYQQGGGQPQGQQQQGQPQGQPQGQQQGHQQSHANYQNQRPQADNKKAEGMVRHGVICAAIQNGQMKCETWGDVMTYTQFIMTGVIPQEQTNYGGNQTPDQYPDEQSQDTFDDGSDIPF